MKNDNTSGPVPATLSEQELFAIFVKLRITKRSTYGSLKHNSLVCEYTPEDYLRGGDPYGELGDAAQLLSDDLMGDDRPEDMLGRLASALRTFADQLDTVEGDFALFKAAHIIELEGDEPDQTADPEGWEDWAKAWNEYDENPRFLVPALKNGKAA